jgi:translation initiation factor 5B
MSEHKGRLRQPIVVILGHVDSGKCVSGDTLVQLADGGVLDARSVFEAYRQGAPIPRPDGEAFAARGLTLLSVGPDGRAAPRRASYVWKLKADRLVRVETGAGYSVRTTPEHRFLAVRQGGVCYVEAERLRLGDSLLIPTKTDAAQTPLAEVKERILSALSDDFIVRPTREAARTLGRGAALGGDPRSRSRLRTKGLRPGAFRELVRLAGRSQAWGYDNIAGVRFDPPRRRGGPPSPWVSLPRSEAGLETMAYLAGLLYAGGAAEAPRPRLGRIRAAFGRGAARGGWRPLLLLLTDAFRPPGGPRDQRIPPAVSSMPDRLLASFLRGFFDVRGFALQGGAVGVDCRSPALAKELPLLLQRFGCLACAGRGAQSRLLFIAGEGQASAFHRSIGLREPRVAKARAPRTAWDRPVFGAPPLGPLGSVEDGQLPVREGRHLMAALVGGVVPRSEPHTAGLMSNFSMVEVTKLESEEGDFEVFDFTVDETHNFVANGLVIHNTSLADALRGTGVQAREVGGITQEIGASFFPMETLRKISGSLLDRAGGELQIPGLLLIDTPGHAVFSNLRMRGGSAADIAILVVDVLKGLENQTLESIDILKQRRVPFLIALNKVDMIAGWKKGSQGPLAQIMKDQPPSWNDELEERLYNVVGGLSRLGFQADAYYRVKDFRQQVSIVPVSARTHAGIPEMLAMLIGLAQQFLKGRLEAGEDKAARGIILELQEEAGIGGTANVILTEGTLSVGDPIVLVRREGAFKSKVKALFMPKPLDEMRDPRDKFTPVESVHAAAGVKLVSPDLAGVVAGTSVASFRTEKEFQALKAEMDKELSNVVVKTNNMGVIVKAGSIGGLEALLRMLEERGVPVRQADIGDISKNDIVDAQVVGEHDPYLGAILGFDSKVLPEAKEYAGGVPIFVSGIIYEVIDNYVSWATGKRDSDERAALSGLTRPCKLVAIPGMFFRRNSPAVFGVEVVAGTLRPKVKLMSAGGVELGVVEQIQDQGKALSEARSGDKVAISVEGPTLGRQIKENDVIYTMPRSHEAKLLRTKLYASLTEKEHEVLEEIMRIKSSADPMYGF